MKNQIFILSLLLLLLASGVLWAQEDDFRTIFNRDDKDKKDWRISGFGGPIMQFTSVQGNFAHMMGGGGAVTINDFYFGGYGLGMTTQVPYKNQEDEFHLDFGHGGLWFGYVLKPNSPVHLDFSTLMGWGAVSRTLNTEDFDIEPASSDPVFVITPVMEVELNFSRFFRLGAGASFSYVSGAGISRTAYTWKDFGNPAFFLSFRFGYFY